MYSLYKDPSGEVNLNFSNITTNLTGPDKKQNKEAKKVNHKKSSVHKPKNDLTRFQFHPCLTLHQMQEMSMNMNLTSSLKGPPSETCTGTVDQKVQFTLCVPHGFIHSI